MYTPVNEPLTTARFSGLYGHWYPHGRDMACFFLRCLVNECLATLFAMREIRAVNPEARRVQTEDLGKVFSTPALAAQPEHGNARRWLSLDLLCGRVDRHHPWHTILLAHGIAAAELGARARLSGAWQRYGSPLAITEVHHGSTREGQLRWLAEVWQGSLALRCDGVDLRAPRPRHHLPHAQ